MTHRRIDPLNLAGMGSDLCVTPSNGTTMDGKGEPSAIFPIIFYYLVVSHTNSVKHWKCC